jgi:hypothetical protein
MFINCFDFLLLLIEVFNRHSSSGKITKETPNEPLNLNLLIHNRLSHHYHHIDFLRLLLISTAVAIFAKRSAKLHVCSLGHTAPDQTVERLPLLPRIQEISSLIFGPGTSLS